MKQIELILCFFVMSYTSNVFGQKLNYKVDFDIDFDGTKEQLLFFDDLDGEFENTEFTKFCVRYKNKEFCVENNEAWVLQNDTYSIADKEIDKRVGIIRDNGKTFFWLTGFQYGCCLNKTTIVEWKNYSLVSIFNENYVIDTIEIINNKKYIIGQFDFDEVYGEVESDFYFSGFYPFEYRLLSENMKIDSILTKKKCLSIFETIEKSIDVYSAVLIHVNYNPSTILISKKLQSSLMDREYGIISLIKLDKNYFKKYNKSQLRIIRNEIYAYHGYYFNSQDLFSYFSQKKWYKPYEKNVDLISTKLSEIEIYNIELIQNIENNGW